MFVEKNSEYSRVVTFHLENIANFRTEISQILDSFSLYRSNDMTFGLWEYSIVENIK